MWFLTGKLEELKYRYKHRPGNYTTLPHRVYLQWKQLLRFNEGSYCFTCGLPEDVCEKEGATGRCFHIDKVLPLILLSWERRLIREKISRRIEREFESQEEFTRWIGRDYVTEGERTTNGLQLFQHILVAIFK